MVTKNNQREDKIDEAQADRFNPNGLQNSEQKTGENAGINAGIEQAQAYANDNSNSSKNIDKAKKSEESGGNKYSYYPGISEKANRGGKVKAFFKKKGATGAILVLLLLGIGGPLALLPLGPIMFFENITDDLNDQVSAMDTRFGYMKRNKLPSAEKKQAIAGCARVLTIRCKFATIGSKQVEKLKFAGITVEGNKSLIPGRTVPEKYTFRGTTYSAAEWSKALRTNSEIIRAQRTANNARYASVSDKSFMNKVYKRFGITKRAPELKGTPNERVRALLNKAGTGNVTDLGYTPILDDKGKPTGDYHLNGDPDGRVYTQKQVDKSLKSIERVKNAKPPSKATKASIGALSVVGYWDLACSINKMVSGATLAAKVANQAQLVEYVAPVASSVYKIKAGDGTVEDGETIGRFFNDKDVQKTVADVAGTNFNGQNGEDLSVNGDIADKENPNYNKSALDSSLYAMSSGGGVAPMNESRAQFSLGYGESTLESVLGGVSNTLSTVLNGGTDGKVCNVVQNWFVRSVGIVATGILAVVSGGGITAGQIAIAGSLVASMFLLDYALSSALKNDLIENADLENNPVARGDALWTGEAAMLSAGSQARGLIPGNAQEITAYQQQQKETLLAYNEVERNNVTNQLDTKDRFSFAGSLSRNIAASFTGSSTFTKYGSLVSSVFSGSIFTPAFADTVDESRFKTCDDKAYKELGIDADVQCNVRFYMPAADLALDTDNVAKYMEDNYVDAQTGLPEDYTPPEESEAQSGAVAFAKSTGKGLVSGFLPPDELPNDYARFLSYCAYRTMPFGEVFGENQADNKDWTSGKKCMTKGAPFSYFRIYTLDKTIQEAEDDEGLTEDDSVDDGSSSTPNNGNVTWPVDKKFWEQDRADFLGEHTYNSGTYTSGVNRLATDISTPPDGTAVYAMVGGKVTKADLGGHGLIITSEIEGGSLEIAYAHGPRTNQNTTYSAGDKIMEIGALGNVTGGHLHIDMALDGKGICAQDVFLALDKNETPNWTELVKKGIAPCGRS